jgi:TPR repeat protein
MSVSSARTPDIDAQTALLKRRPAVARGIRMLRIAFAAALLALSSAGVAEAQSVRSGVAALNRQDYVSASRILIPLAEQGVAAAQSYLGFMFETGRGVPQNYTEAAMWYRRAAEQGDSAAQYSLGLLYDKGFGVPRDVIEAGKWLNLSAAAAPRRSREARVRIRDAVTTKMTRGELAQARLRALEWAPSREH